MNNGSDLSRREGAEPAGDRTVISWDELKDGMLRRFKRGVHFKSAPEVVERASMAAALEHGKVAKTTIEQLGRRQYLWVQFVDGKVESGASCPKCGGDSLERHHQYFARCSSCTSLLEFVEKPRLDRLLTAPEDDLQDADDNRVVALLDIRLASGEERADETNVLEETIVEMRYQFFRPADNVDVRLGFFLDETKVFNALCPDLIAVSRPQTLTFQLRISPRILSAGEYSVTARIRGNDGGPDPFRALYHQALSFRAVDPRQPRSPKSKPTTRRQRPGLAWEVLDAS